MLETPDLRFFGRSEQLHLGYHALLEFHKTHQRLPYLNKEEVDQVVEISKKINESNKASEGLTVEELDENVIRNVA